MLFPEAVQGLVTQGAAAVAEWMQARALRADDARWYIEVGLDIVERPAQQRWNGDTDSRFHLYLYPTEWGYFFCHGSRASWIRIGERPYVHGRDDYNLLPATPALAKVSRLVSDVEQRHRIEFRREHAVVRTNLADAEPAIRAWVRGL